MIKVFKSVDNIYKYSNDYFKFIKILNQNKLLIQKSLISSLIDKNLKEKSHRIYENFKVNNINITTIFSKEFPQNLLQLHKVPYAIFTYGNTSLLYSKHKIYTYFADYFSVYGKNIYNSHIKYIENMQGINVYNNMSYLKTVNSIYILDDDILNENFILKSEYSNSNLYIFVVQNDAFQKYELLAGICDKILIPEAMYEKDICFLTDIILEIGKDILVVPGSIYNRKCYFSNFLIKEGANVILYSGDIDRFL